MKIGQRISYRVISLLLAGLLPLMLSQCKVSYSFSGVNISPEISTYSVQYFQNRAPVVQADLSQIFTEALIDKIQANTSLDLTNNAGDIIFSGEIRNYEVRPTAITGEEVAARNRLTITVKVNYNNNTEPDQNFEQNFSRYEEYDATQDLASVETLLIETIVDYLVVDIFNRAFVNW